MKCIENKKNRHKTMYSLGIFIHHTDSLCPLVQLSAVVDIAWPELNWNPIIYLRYANGVTLLKRNNSIELQLYIQIYPEDLKLIHILYPVHVHCLSDGFCQLSLSKSMIVVHIFSSTVSPVLIYIHIKAITTRREYRIS